MSPKHSHILSSNSVNSIKAVILLKFVCQIYSITSKAWLFTKIINKEKPFLKQECIPVGCVPPERWPYLPACSATGGMCAWSRGVYLVWGDVPGPGGRGVYLVGGVYLVRGVYLVWGVYLVPGGCTWSWGVPGPQGGVPGPRGYTWSQGVYLVPGGTWSGGVPGQVLPPTVDRITDPCKNITLPQLRCGQ